MAIPASTEAMRVDFILLVNFILESLPIVNLKLFFTEIPPKYQSAVAVTHQLSPTRQRTQDLSDPHSALFQIILYHMIAFASVFMLFFNFAHTDV